MPKPQCIAVTVGEPAGIGPDLCLMLAQQPSPIAWVAVGSKTLLKERAHTLKLPITLEDFDPTHTLPAAAGTLRVVNIPLRAPVTPGVLAAANSAYVMETLDTGYALCESKQCQALLTLPVHKAILAQSGYAFTGHTEYLAKLAGVPEVLMIFHTPKIIVGLVTTHLPLQAVAAQITPERVSKSIQLMQQGFRELFNKPQPNIGVLGLNPHAGENGLLGYEEQEYLCPIIEQCQQNQQTVTGPLSGDTAFAPASLESYDALLAMYHDQGLAPIKALYFGQLVNVTLGLPFLRVSVDHGTALDKAGTGKISTQSLETAFEFLRTLP